jgi:ribonuclease P protein component
VIIDKVFETGKVIVGPSFKLIWLKAEERDEQPVKIVITVPKRNFKKAVHRNKLKRRFREIYRKNKIELYSDIKSGTIYIMLMYTGRELITYTDAEAKIKKMLSKLNAEMKS